MSRYNIKHGLSNHRLYHIWSTMKQRCYNKKAPKYKDYGARGIRVCQEWLNDFQAFYNWAMDNGYKENLTIDRIDVDKGYSPGNCHWADVIEQNNNKTNCIYIEYDNKSYTIAQWSRILNISEGALRKRYDRGWPPDECLFGRNKKCGTMN